MNFVALVGRLRRKCRVEGASPTTLANQPEEINRLADWINEAWMDIQLTKPDWNWMRSTFSFPTVNGQPTYTPVQAGIAANTFANWKRDSIRNYPTAAGVNGEIQMDYRAYDSWRDMYLFGANRSNYSRPTDVTITPEKYLAFGPIAASGYTITGDFYTVASELVADADTPSLPVQFHMAIVYRAMMFYGASEAAQEVFTEGETEFKRMMGRLTIDRLREVTTGGALA